MLLPMTAIRPVITGLLFYLSFCSNQAREFGVVLLDLVEDLRAFRLFGKLTDELQIRWRRLDMSRDRCLYTGVGGIESVSLSSSETCPLQQRRLGQDRGIYRRSSKAAHPI